MAPSVASPGGLLTGEGRSAARDRHHSPTPPIFQDHHKEPQTPGTGYKKNKNQALASGLVNPPPPASGPCHSGAPTGNHPNSQYPQEHGELPHHLHVTQSTSVLRTEK